MKRLFCLFFVFLFFNVSSQTLQSVNGVHAVSFDVKEGSIYVYIPENIVKEMAFSGTVAVFPKGVTSREQAKNVDKLKKYKIQTLNMEFSAGSKSFLATNTSGTTDISLKSVKEKFIAKQQITFNFRTVLSSETPLSLPSHIANNVNTSFYGVFDGNIRNTSATANDKKVKVIAESPVQVSLRPENLNTTISSIQVIDGDNEYTGQCNSIYYTLAIGPTNLKRGQSTFFDATIHGVGTINEALTYTVRNATPTIVTLNGGNSQSFMINPGDGENGNWFRHFTIKSNTTGNFTLNTSLNVPDTPYPSSDNTQGGLVSEETPVSQNTVDCRLYNQSLYVTGEECTQLGGQAFTSEYTSTIIEPEEYIEVSEVDVITTQDSNEIELQFNIQGGDIPEMVVSTMQSLNSNTATSTQFIPEQQQEYSFSHKNLNFGSPDAATIETTLLFSNGGSQTIHTQVQFLGNTFYSIAESEELTGIRRDQNKIKSELQGAQNTKKNLQKQRDSAQARYIRARDKFNVNHSQFWYLWRIDQSLEKAKPAFIDTLKVLTDSLKAFNKRTNGAPNKVDAQKIDDNLRDAKKRYQECLDQIQKLQQEQTDLTNEKEVLKEQQKQIHRDIMNHFRTTGMNFAGATRRDKNGKFHYQYGVVTVSGEGTATYHKGSLPAQILSKVAALEKQMKLTTDRLNTIHERLQNIVAELAAKNTHCGLLAKQVKDAETAKKNKDAIIAEAQYWNNKINEICRKIEALLTHLKKWAAINDATLLAKINNMVCGENIWIHVDGIINRKKVLEKEFEDTVRKTRSSKNAEKEMRDALNDKIKDEERKIAKLQKDLIVNQDAEAKAAAIALANDEQKCIGIMRDLGYGGTSITDVIDLYEISQDLKKATDEAKNALEHLRKAAEYGNKHGLDTGSARKWVKNTQKRLSDISKKLAKIKEYGDLAKKIQKYAKDIGTLIGSDGTPTQNAEAFGIGLNYMNEALEAIASKLPILQVFTAYFTFITKSYSAIMKGGSKALRKQYQQLLSDVKSKMNCETMMRICRNNNDDLAKIKEWAYKEYVVIPGFDLIRREQSQAKDIISKLVEQQMAECCFKRLQAIKAAQK